MQPGQGVNHTSRRIKCTALSSLNFHFVQLTCVRGRYPFLSRTNLNNISIRVLNGGAWRITTIASCNIQLHHVHVRGRCIPCAKWMPFPFEVAADCGPRTSIHKLNVRFRNCNQFSRHIFTVIWLTVSPDPNMKRRDARTEHTYESSVD